MGNDNKTIDGIDARGAETIPSKSIKDQLKDQEMELVRMDQQNLKGVDATVKVIDFIASGYNAATNALADDGKISLVEGISMGVSLAPKAYEAFKSIPEVPEETVFDKLSEEDVTKLVATLDEFEKLKGDTRDAVKDLLPIINDLKNWGIKYFGKEAQPAQ